MATIGYDAEIVLDNQGYLIKPGSYLMRQLRIRKATIRADGGEAYVDLGPGKRVWSMVILCLNDLLRYDGTLTGLTGQQYRDALRTSYLNSTGSTILYSDPINATAVAVHFDQYSEQILDLHSQVVALATGSSLAASYQVAIELVEA
ncbi:hypothetical protein EPA93_09265 [Ktedonosporobacter rubrisoli]|uniref:Uncharacterized protein n=1 Tax=Ktedonosporobacter rubrisoli TaxID=2509675 RepID=A0A4P6JLT1_KTERU|nr:hypothetical protein [Ktedonosporobacter rubrisoli]QBD76188.1 hypothetical protein EPA93_09265 [Ktedonosporobacter rubrisoli]